MSDPGPALRLLLDALREGLARPEVRAALGDLGRWLISVAEPPTVGGAASTPEPSPAPTQAEAPVTPPASQIEDRPMSRPAPISGPAVPTTLRIGDSNPLEVVTRGEGIVSTRQIAFEPPPPPPRREEGDELPDLRAVAQSARLKAEACRRAASSESCAALRDEILAVRAGQAEFDGGLWMCAWLDGEGRERAARAEPCYRALAEAAELGAFLREKDQLHPGLGLEDPFQLMAQAQSMVRNFVGEGRGEDLDQLAVFHWLRTLTSADRCRVLVGRYMRRSDVASPSDAEKVLAGLASMRAAWKSRLEGAKERRRLIGKLRHKCGLLAAAGLSEAAALWHDLERVHGELLSLGTRRDDPEILSGLAGAPDPPGDGALSAELLESLRHARPRARHEDAGGEDEPESAAPSPEVAEVARLLHGRVALLIGGEVRPLRRDAIERAFGLQELRWSGANMNDSSTDLFEPQLRRPETALVIRMVRFTRTNHGELLELCKRYRRPFVNLPGGYSVNQLASQILTQAGDQLRALPPIAGVEAR